MISSQLSSEVTCSYFSLDSSAYSPITYTKEFFKLHTIWNTLKLQLKCSLHLVITSALLLLLQSQVIEPECQSFTSFLISVYISAVYLSVGFTHLYLLKKKKKKQAELLFTAYVQVWSIVKGKSDSLISIIWTWGVIPEQWISIFHILLHCKC